MSVARREDAVAPSIASRLWRRDVFAMFVRNTVVSCVVFGVGLVVLWLLVEHGNVDKTIAAGISFVVANTLHYLAARAWIFRGTEREAGRGYVYFLFNGGVGLVITIGLFAALIRWTSIHYLAARVLVSLVAGLAIFALNAIFNFRRV